MKVKLIYIYITFNNKKVYDNDYFSFEDEKQLIIVLIVFKIEKRKFSFFVFAS